MIEVTIFSKSGKDYMKFCFDDKYKDFILRKFFKNGARSVDFGYGCIIVGINEDKDLVVEETNLNKAFGCLIKSLYQRLRQLLTHFLPLWLVIYPRKSPILVFIGGKS